MKKILVITAAVISIATATASAMMCGGMSGDHAQHGQQGPAKTGDHGQHGQQGQGMAGSQVTYQQMMLDMSEMMHQMQNMMHVAMDQKQGMDHSKMKDLQKVMQDMSVTMQEMSQQMGAGNRDPVAKKTMDERMKAMNSMLDSMQKGNN